MWSLSLNDGVGLSPFVAIDDVVVEGKVFLRSHSERQMFLPNLIEPPHGGAICLK